MRRLLLLLCLLSLGAAPVKIVGPTQVDPYRLVELSPEGDVADCGLIWDIDREDVADVKEYGTKLVFVGPPGTYKVKLRIISFKDKSITTSRIVVVIGTPAPPKPPDPPIPVPQPAPIQADGLHVMILVESAELGKMSAAQKSILFSKPSIDYLNTHCAADPQTDSKKAWWMLDKDTDISMLAKHWQDAKARPRASVPWLIVSNPQKGGGWEGPLPATLDEAMSIFKRFGGE